MTQLAWRLIQYLKSMAISVLVRMTFICTCANHNCKLAYLPIDFQRTHGYHMHKTSTKYWQSQHASTCWCIVQIQLLHAIYFHFSETITTITGVGFKLSEQQVNTLLHVSTELHKAMLCLSMNIPGVPEKAERWIFSTLRAKSIIFVYVIRS